MNMRKLTGKSAILAAAIAASAAFPMAANAWTVTSKGREEFSKLKAKAIP